MENKLVKCGKLSISNSSNLFVSCFSLISVFNSNSLLLSEFSLSLAVSIWVTKSLISSSSDNISFVNVSTWLQILSHWQRLFEVQVSKSSIVGQIPSALVWSTPVKFDLGSHELSASSSVLHLVQ